MLSVPAAQAPSATAISENIELKILTSFGAMTNPTMQVNKTKDITLGFIKLKNESM